MQLDVTVNLLRKTETALSTYKTTGFVDAQISAMDMYNDMNVEAVLQQKRLKSMKKHFSYESPDEPINDALKKLEVTFFNVVVDAAISSLQKRMQTLREVSQFWCAHKLPKLVKCGADKAISNPQ